MRLAPLPRAPSRGRLDVNPRREYSRSTCGLFRWRTNPQPTLQ